jgi:hypothetical protein
MRGAPTRKSDKKTTGPAAGDKSATKAGEKPGPDKPGATTAPGKSSDDEGGDEPAPGDSPGPGETAGPGSGTYSSLNPTQSLVVRHYR